MPPQHGQCLAANRFFGSQPGTELIEKMLDQLGNVFGALTKRWDFDAHYGEAIEQILAEAPRLDLGSQVPVGRGEDAHIYLGMGGLTDPFDLSPLQHTEQLGLHLERQLADLVEEDRASRGRFEGPGPCSIRSREGASLVPEELALHEILWDGAAIHRDPGSLRSRRRLMKRPRDELLPRSALSFDEDRGVCGRHALEQSEDPTHRRRDAEEAPKTIFGAQGNLQVLSGRRELHLRAPDTNHGSGLEEARAHTEAIDGGPVRALQIRQHEPLGRRADLEVMGGNR